MSEPAHAARSSNWTPRLTQELSDLFEERFSAADAVRLQHGRAECFHPDMPPDSVVFATSTADDFIWARATEDHSRLWDARHKAHFAALALAPGKTSLTTDVCVPISRLAHCISEARRIIDESGLIGPIVDHVGDGNFHVILLFDAESGQEMERAKSVSSRLVRLAIANGGTCTGEHGVGLGKKEYLLEEQGEAVEVMRAVKRALDPANIMNPDKVLDL